MKGGAVISPCGHYRYILGRIFDPKIRLLGVILLNPSTADATKDDPTIRKCVTLARNWGFGGILVANLFAFRATDPRELMEAKDPVGPENNAWLEKVAERTSRILCGWGNHGVLAGRGEAVLKMLAGKKEKLVSVGVNMNGMPKHPLYARNDSKPIPYES